MSTIADALRAKGGSFHRFTRKGKVIAVTMKNAPPKGKA